MKKVLLAGGGIAATLIALVAFAGNAEDGARMRHRTVAEKRPAPVAGVPGQGPLGERMVRALGLTETQLETWREGESARRDEVRPLAEKLRELRSATHTLLEGAEPDAATVGELVISAHKVEAQLAGVRRAHEAAFVSMLDDEQRIRFETLQEMRRDREGGPHDGAFRPRRQLRSPIEP
jgi:Spy/CpxP family protein refolding chaperone